MRLLYLSPQIPWPPVSGARMRVYQLIRSAAQRHGVDLLSFAAPAEFREVPQELRTCCGRVELAPTPRTRGMFTRLAGLVTSPRPDLAERLWSEEFQARVLQTLSGGHYDAVQACGLEMGRYLLGLRGPLRVLDEFNVEHALQSGAARTDLSAPGAFPGAAYSLLQASRLRRFEAAVCQAADLVLSVSEDDAAALRSLAPGASVQVVPNGVDSAALTYHDPLPEPAPNLLFSGSMDYRPNADAALWFIRAALPAITDARPEVRFFAVGHSPRTALVDCVKVNPAVAVTGSVPSMGPYWDLASVYVLPMRIGGGVRFKAMEALSVGIPLVSTEFGVQGIGAVPDVHFLRAENGHEFTAAVLRLLADHPLRLRLARAGRALVERRHDWSRITPRLVAAYEALESRSSPR